MIPELRYIVIKDRNDEEHAILFPKCNGLWHKDVTRIHRAGDVRLVSAGFCRLNIPADRRDAMEVTVHGKAESLGPNAAKFKSRPEDAEIIAKGLFDE